MKKTTETWSDEGIKGVIEPPRADGPKFVELTAEDQRDLKDDFKLDKKVELKDLVRNEKVLANLMGSISSL